MKNLRQRIGREEFDYLALMAALSEYANPRDKVTALLRQGDVIRIKKGLYIFGDELRRRPFSRQILANLIRGPSFVSLDSALAFHSLIPERVEATTSVTTRRPKVFATPVGSFIYRQSPKTCFHLGVERMAEGDVAFLIASPERALADKVRDDRGHPLRTQNGAEEYLFDNLRIDPAEFELMDPNLLDELAGGLQSRKVAICAKLLRNLRAKP